MNSVHYIKCPACEGFLPKYKAMSIGWNNGVVDYFCPDCYQRISDSTLTVKNHHHMELVECYGKWEWV